MKELQRDPKEMMATLLIQHNLLKGRAWGRFHKDIQKIDNEYYPINEKNFDKWIKGGMKFNI